MVDPVADNLARSPQDHILLRLEKRARVMLLTPINLSHCHVDRVCFHDLDKHGCLKALGLTRGSGVPPPKLLRLILLRKFSVGLNEPHFVPSVNGMHKNLLTLWQELLMWCLEAICETSSCIWDFRSIWAEKILPALGNSLSASDQSPEIKFTCVSLLSRLLPELLHGHDSKDYKCRGTDKCALHSSCISGT